MSTGYWYKNQGLDGKLGKRVTPRKRRVIYKYNKENKTVASHVVVPKNKIGMEGVYQAGIFLNMFNIICQIIWYLEVSLTLYSVKVMKFYDNLVCSKTLFQCVRLL